MPLPTKVETITQFKQPFTVKGLQEFVGMVNLYHRFTPAAAKMMSLLYSALAGKPKTLEWSEPMVAAFQDTKAALTRAVMLVHLCSNAPTSLTVDASEQAVGAVLQQLLNAIWQPLAFFSVITLCTSQVLSWHHLGCKYQSTMHHSSGISVCTS